MENNNQEVVQETVQTQEVKEEMVSEEVSQETQPEQKEEEKNDTKTFTQKDIDDILKRRLSRQEETLLKQQETLLAQKESELTDKLKSIESDTQKLAEALKQKDTELTRLRFGIKEDKFDEVLALTEFRMKKDPELTEEAALKSVLEERPDYIEKTIKQIGIEIKQDVKEIPLYSEQLLNMYPFLKKI